MNRPISVKAKLINGRFVVQDCPYCADYHVHIPRKGLHSAPCNPHLQYELIQDENQE